MFCSGSRSSLVERRQLCAVIADKNREQARRLSRNLAEARRLYPKLSVKWLSVRKPILQPAFEGLRKAGLPEE